MDEGEIGRLFLRACRLLPAAILRSTDATEFTNWISNRVAQISDSALCILISRLSSSLSRTFTSPSHPPAGPRTTGFISFSLILPSSSDTPLGEHTINVWDVNSRGAILD